MYCFERHSSFLRIKLTAPDGLADTEGSSEGIADWDGLLDSVGFFEIKYEQILDCKFY